MTQDTRLSPSYFPYDARLCFEIALGLEPIDVVLERYNIDKERFSELLANPTFKKQILDFKREIKEKGLSFKEKAKMMAEDLLTTAYDIIHHQATSAAVKADLIKWTARVAGYEVPNDAAPQNFLPALQQTLKEISTGDLEIQVMQIVKRRQQPEEQDITAEVLQLH
jgi:hypothetical protein